MVQFYLFHSWQIDEYNWRPKDIMIAELQLVEVCVWYLYYMYECFIMLHIVGAEDHLQGAEDLAHLILVHQLLHVYVLLSFYVHHI